MQFWDTSALVPLLINEPSTARVRAVHAADRRIAASFLTQVEITSALWRRRHWNTLTADEHFFAERRFASLSDRWLELEPEDLLLASATDVLSRHALRAGDAIQLASALIACDGAPAELPFVTLDRDLATAARAEGFPVLP